MGRVTDIHSILHEPVAGADDGKGDSTILLYTVKKVIEFSVPSRDVTAGDDNKLI